MLVCVHTCSFFVSFNIPDKVKQSICWLWFNLVLCLFELFLVAVRSWCALKYLISKKTSRMMRISNFYIVKGLVWTGESGNITQQAASSGSHWCRGWWAYKVKWGREPGAFSTLGWVHCGSDHWFLCSLCHKFSLTCIYVYGLLSYGTVSTIRNCC